MVNWYGKNSGVCMKQVLVRLLAAWVWVAILSGPGHTQSNSDDFNRDTPLGAFWATEQLQNGSLDIVQDPTNASNKVLKALAGAKSGGKVGKADLIQRFEPVGPGGTIHMSSWFYFPKGTPRNSVILFDLECASCGLDTNPGLRVYLRDGRLRVDLSKIGIKDALLPSTDHQVPSERWFKLGWTVKLGVEGAGQTQITLDDKVVLAADSTTMPSTSIARKLLGHDITEAVDRIQIGLTANSNNKPALIYVDNVVTKIGR